MRIGDKIEAAVQLISALLGAFVFTLGVGSATLAHIDSLFKRAKPALKQYYKRMDDEPSSAYGYFAVAVALDDPDYRITG